jgi:dolichyl-phosphate beta-glucosyltransferase
MSVCRPIIEAAQIDRFAFDVELIYVARLAGLRVCEIPVRWDDRPGSKIDLVSDSFRMVSQVLSIRDRARRGQYDAALNATRQLTSDGPQPTVRYVTEEN